MDKDELVVYIFFVSVGLTPAGTICYLSRNVLISILGGYLGYTPTTQVVIPVKLPAITGGYLHIGSYI